MAAPLVELRAAVVRMAAAANLTLAAEVASGLHQRRGWGVAPQWVTGRARLPIAGRLHRGRARQVAMPHRPTLRAVAAAPSRRLPRHRLRRARDSRDPAEIQPRARDGRDAAAREARATSRREKLSAIWCSHPRLCTSTLFLGRSIVDALRRTPPNPWPGPRGLAHWRPEGRAAPFITLPHMPPAPFESRRATPSPTATCR